MKNRFRHRLSTLFSDNDGEFLTLSNRFASLCIEHRISPHIRRSITAFSSIGTDISLKSVSFSFTTPPSCFDTGPTLSRRLCSSSTDYRRALLTFARPTRSFSASRSVRQPPHLRLPLQPLAPPLCAVQTRSPLVAMVLRWLVLNTERVSMP